MIWGHGAALILLVALLLDALVGDPDWLWRRLPHPIVWFGRLIARLDSLLNDARSSFGRRKFAGAAAVAVLVLVAGGAGVGLHIAFQALSLGLLFETVVVAVFLAQRSLHDHVARVVVGFRSGGLPEARRAVAMIVGRDPDALDEAAVCRAAIETTAENFSDGVVAPAFWYLVAGLPGLLIYKAVNTADSMIGHKSERYLAFGWAAARLDDVLNLAPSRLSGLLFVGAAPFVGGSATHAARAMLRDARRHRSPNAGWPEAAMAGAFGLALAGPRRYGGELIEDGWMNAGGRSETTPQDIRKGLRLLWGGWAVLVGAVGAIVWISW